jgi:predicted nucleic acid-binding protein
VTQTSQAHFENLVSSALHAGERAAITLALAIEADLMLMDVRAGVEEARRLGIAVTGTPGVLARGAERGLISLPTSLARLQSTNFRARPEILRQILLNHAKRS